MNALRARALRLVLVAAASTGLAGCYGSFTAVKKLHAWNGTIDNGGIMTQAVFWVFGALQVYTLFALGDVFIFNLLEFWTGSNPVADSGEVQMVDGAIQVDRDGKTWRIEQVGPETLRVEVDGLHIGDAEMQADGALLVRDRHTGETLLLTPEMLRAQRTGPAAAVAL